jgi:hypothetical protein
MLERQGLVLCPWGAPDAPGGLAPRRAVLDAATGEPLGFLSRAPRPRWLRWLTATVLELYETEDASLLCVLRGPSWARRSWEVEDSEGRHVASVLREVVLDAEGARQAVLRRFAGGGTFCNPSGLELASFASSPRGTVLTFTPAVEGQPFARMALLGATVAAGG